MIPRLARIALVAPALAALLAAPACGKGAPAPAPVPVDPGALGPCGADPQTGDCPPPPAAPPVDATAAAPAVLATNPFGFDLYRELVAKDPSGNLVFSPMSVATALAMTYAGAAGDTAAQMRAALHLPDGDVHAAFGALLASLAADRGDGVTLAVANRLWAQAGFTLLPSFTAVQKAAYGAGVAQVDYVRDADGARKTINAWVADQTRDRVRDLIPDGVLDSLTRLVLTNAIYFKGAWETRFDKALTKDAPFKKLDGATATVPLMRRTGETPYGYAEVPGAGAVDIVKLPFRGGSASLVVLVPRAADGLPALEAAAPGNLATWLSNLHTVEVSLALPRLSLDVKTSLPAALQALGMRDAFDVDAADLSGIDGERDLHIADVIHQANITLDEEGAVAAAATAVVIVTESARIPVEVTADHPFMFVLRDELTGANLFLGRLAAP